MNREITAEDEARWKAAYARAQEIIEDSWKDARHHADAVIDASMRDAGYSEKEIVRSRSVGATKKKTSASKVIALTLQKPA